MSQVPLTANRIVILRALEKGPQKWSVLREEYFGPGRSEEAASTAFYMQVKGMIGKGLVTKSPEGYQITATGKEAIEACRKAGFDIEGAKSQAHLKWEAAHPTASTTVAATAVEAATQAAEQDAEVEA